MKTKELNKGEIIITSQDLHKPIYEFFKRILDVICSVVALIVLSPVFLVTALAVRSDGGPAFYKQTRVGKNNTHFEMYKFRSMVTDADKMIERFTPEQKREYEQNYKLENDPRITRVGKFLRATSLDELPQLVNVLKGELSLVGPRPVVEDELAKYGENADKFLSVTPGVTGYWQANGRSDTTYEQRMEMELYYVDHASAGLDLKILWDTVWAVLKRKGAK